MSRRKHLLLQTMQEDVDPPAEGQHIVRAVGSRGSNIIETDAFSYIDLQPTNHLDIPPNKQVEFPEGRKTLCLLPAKFHKKLWIKRGNYLIVEDFEDADTQVTGQILHVLYDDHVKQLKKIEGVWPEQFIEKNDHLVQQLDDLTLSNAKEKKKSKEPKGNDVSANNDTPNNDTVETESESSSDDDLPPIQRIQNRKVVQYVSDSDSDDE